MERSELSLVPQWLRGTTGSSSAAGGSINGANTSTSAGSGHLSQQSGGGGGPHQDDGQVAAASQPRHQRPLHHDSTYEPPRFGSSFFSGSRGVGAGERSFERDRDRDMYAHGRDQQPRAYPSFGRSSSHRVYKEASDLDWGRDRDRTQNGHHRDSHLEQRDQRDQRDLSHEVDERERERERDRVIERDRERDAVDRQEAGPVRRGSVLRAYEDAPGLRRSQSLASTPSGRLLAEEQRENERRKSGEHQSGAVTPTAAAATAAAAAAAAAAAGAAAAASGMSKMTFERNFPSLSTPELAPGHALLGMGNQGSAGSPRSLWQSSAVSPRGDVPRAARGLSNGPLHISSGMGLSSGPAPAAEGWSSALAEVPSTLMASLPIAEGGAAIAAAAAAAAAQAAAAASAAALSPPVSGSSVSTLSSMPTPAVPGGASVKMAEALVQSAGRSRQPAQASLEAQRLEEIALKQSRQLIPMKPSLPKALGQSPRDKGKLKISAPPGGSIGRASDLPSPLSTTPPAITARQSGGPRGAEASAKPSGSKLVVMRSSSSKEIALKGQDATSASLPIVASATVSGMVTASGPRKQVQLLDRHALPITTAQLAGSNVSLVSGLKAKEGPMPVISTSATVEEKKAKTDFFNALRKKAGGKVTMNDSPPGARLGDADGTTEEKKLAAQRAEAGGSPRGHQPNGSLDEDHPVQVKVELQEVAFLQNGTPSDDSRHLQALEGRGNEVPGFHEVKQQGQQLLPAQQLQQQQQQAGELKVSRLSIAGGSEEEEAAFLRSLGWTEEGEEEGDDALTEEEINAFYKEANNATLRALPRPSKPLSVPIACAPRNLVLPPVGSVGSVSSSGLSSSDSDSDDEGRRHLSAIK